MRAREIFLTFGSLAFGGCALPPISPQGAKVKVVNQSACPVVGSFMTVRKENSMALNYKAATNQVFNMNLARDRASRMGGSQIVELFVFDDKPTDSIVAFYSVHKCGS